MRKLLSVFWKINAVCTAVILLYCVCIAFCYWQFGEAVEPMDNLGILTIAAYILAVALSIGTKAGIIILGISLYLYFKEKSDKEFLKLIMLNVCMWLMGFIAYAVIFINTDNAIITEILRNADLSQLEK